MSNNATSTPSAPWIVRHRIAATIIAFFAAGALAVYGTFDDTGTDSDLLPAHREMVDNLAAEGDCSSLQARFDDAADAVEGFGGDPTNNDRNLALMDYADDALRRIGCYD